jgi:hypothetical protein
MREARKRPKTRAAGKPTAGVDSAAIDRLDVELAALKGLDIDGLRLRWRKLFRSAAPAHLPRYLLARIIAYRLQANVFGDLDRETVRFLDRVAQDWKKDRASGVPRAPKAVPPVPPVPNHRSSLKPGTLLAREHGGTMHRVVVIPDGFLWNETTYGSLSEVAGAITGTNWNGPRFFGLREKAANTPASPASTKGRGS